MTAGHDAVNPQRTYVAGQRGCLDSIEPNADSSGRAKIATLREPQSLEERLAETVVVLASLVVQGFRGQRQEGGVLDLDQAFAHAAKLRGRQGT